ncbi:MAG: cellulase N-terminal Ig-like domain-containing protein [Ilumatobacteraceae bacterium]
MRRLSAPAALALAAALLAACSSTATSGPTRPLTSGETGTTGAAVDGGSSASPPAALTLQLDGGAAIATDATVTATLTAPTGATDVQLSSDPTFADAPWQPLSAAATVTLPDAGYQMVFARVRNGDAGAPSAPVVAGIDVDTTYAAATSSATKGARHQASWAALVAPNVLQVRIEAGRVTRADDGSKLTLVGRKLDPEPLDQATSWRLGDLVPTSVSRISRPVGRTGPDADDTSPLVHDVFLTFTAPIPTRTALTLRVPGGDVDDIAVDLDPSTSYSPAVHVNQVGYAPGDDGKIAELSTWTGGGGGLHYDELGFTVVDRTSGAVVDRGTTTRRVPPAGGGAARATSAVRRCTPSTSPRCGRRAATRSASTPSAVRRR